MTLGQQLAYYLGESYRRKILDRLQEQYQQLYQGVVFDIGGRNRGRFVKPKERVERWVFADIEERFHPDMILDVAHMSAVPSESIDVINALELFEHVAEIEKGITECHRTLKPNGTLIISVPFIFPIHADPFDFQRWTEAKWRTELQSAGFSVEQLLPMGGYFTVLADMLKTLSKSLPLLFRILSYPLYPVLDLMTHLDALPAVSGNATLKGYTTGYFIIAKK